MKLSELNGINAIKIMVANHCGFDKLPFQKRIKWFDNNIEFMVKDDQINLPAHVDKPILLFKALAAYIDSLAGRPTGYLCELDATASGMQVMAALSGCYKTAKAVNMVYPNLRVDLYQEIANLMKDHLQYQIDRKRIKKPVMTHYYNSAATPREYLNDNELNAFYKVLQDKFPGAERILEIINKCWDETALVHSWTMPDGHVVRCKTMTFKEGSYYIKPYDMNLHYMYYINEGNDNYRSLAPNIVHSVDGYIAREMVRRSKKQGFELVHIHDCFLFHPNYMYNVICLYREIMAEIAESNLLSDILSEITGKTFTIEKETKDLQYFIKKSIYMLS